MSILYAIGIELDSIVLSKNSNVSISLKQFIRLVETVLNPQLLGQMNKERLARLNRERYMAAAAAAAMQQETDSHDNGSDIDTIASYGGSLAGDKREMDSERYVDRVIRDSKESGKRKEEKQTVHPSARRGLLLETESSKLKRKPGSGSRSSYAGHSESTGHFKETHALRLRRAHSKIASEVAADKEKHRGIRDSRTIEPRRSHSPSDRGFESLRVTINRSPAPDERSGTSSVIESAEEFLRESAIKQPLFTGANSPREVVVVGSPHSPVREVIDEHLSKFKTTVNYTECHQGFQGGCLGNEIGRQGLGCGLRETQSYPCCPKLYAEPN